jgi:hypothetical protein
MDLAALLDFLGAGLRAVLHFHIADIFLGEMGVLRLGRGEECVSREGMVDRRPVTMMLHVVCMSVFDSWVRLAKIYARGGGEGMVIRSGEDC